MMKETKKSLKAYFLLVGILGIIINLSEIFLDPQALIIIFGFIGIVISSLFIYYGIKMYDYLQKSPKSLTNFVVVALSIMGFFYLISGQLIHLLILVLIGWYLVHNIKKLSLQQLSQETAKNNN